MKHITDSVYESQVDRKGRISISPRTIGPMWRKLWRSYEENKLIVGPHMMDSGYKSIVALYNRRNAEITPIRPIEFSLEEKRIIIPELRDLLRIRDGRVIITGNEPNSIDFWNPNEWKDFIYRRNGVFDESAYDHLVKVSGKGSEELRKEIARKYFQE